MKLNLVAWLGFALVGAGALSNCGSDSSPVDNASVPLAFVKQPPAAPRPSAANKFELGGGSVHLLYEPYGSEGGPLLFYRNGLESGMFRGKEIDVAATEAGTLVSVVTRATVDSGNTTLSLLIPRVEVGVNAAVEVQTEAIITVHRVSLIPALNRGQLDAYSFVPLQGTAVHVDVAPVAPPPEGVYE